MIYVNIIMISLPAEGTFMKKISAIVLLICITCVALVGLTACNGKVSDGTLYYLIKEDNTYEVVESKDPTKTEIIIVETFENKKITSIGKEAFNGCYAMRFVYVIGNGLTTIGEYAFRDCSNLKLITLPDSLTEINYRAFWDCDALKNVTVGAGLTTIGSEAFSGCRNLTNITYNGTVEQWNTIIKGEKWDNDTGAYIIHCTDGDIAKV